MKVQRYKISIYSNNPDELHKFYRDVMEFKFVRKLDIPDDYGYFFELSSNLELFIGKHSEINGPNREPVRHMFDLKVASVKEEFDKIKNDPGIKIIANPFQAPCSQVATFTDPDGNCWQFSE
jgi:predicted enzyme related to lactoylglutathione lyase